MGSFHHETTLSADSFRDFLPSYVWHMEEPVCEPPAIALHFVARLAQETGVKVLLSGEGGDEAFAGYPEYRNLPALEAMIAWLKLLGTRIVFDAHDISTETLKGKMSTERSSLSLLLPLLEQFESLSIRVADLAIATNESILTRIRQKSADKRTWESIRGRWRSRQGCMSHPNR